MMSFIAFWLTGGLLLALTVRIASRKPLSILTLLLVGLLFPVFVVVGALLLVANGLIKVRV
jgi:pheromone shutdown protein TraB